MNDILYLVSLYIYLRLYLSKHVYLKEYFQMTVFLSKNENKTTTKIIISQL